MSEAESPAVRPAGPFIDRALIGPGLASLEAEALGLVQSMAILLRTMSLLTIPIPYGETSSPPTAALDIDRGQT